MTEQNAELNNTNRLIGQVAWFALKSLKNLRPNNVSPIKYNDLKVYMFENLDQHSFHNLEFATKFTKDGELNWLYHLSWAGTLLKKLDFKSGRNGYWGITEEGENFLKQYQGKESDGMQYLGEMDKQFERESVKNEKYLEVKQPDKSKSFDEDETWSEIISHIEQLSPYEFQELVGFLFNGMGYTVPFIAEKGPDGGVDLIAHKDPIAAEGKVIKIQVKHSKDASQSGTSANEIRSLDSLCQSDNAHGVFVSVKGFSREAEKDARKGLYPYVTLIDLSRFIELWGEHIDAIPQDGKAMLPLKQIYVLDTGD